VHCNACGSAASSCRDASREPLSMTFTLEEGCPEIHYTILHTVTARKRGAFAVLCVRTALAAIKLTS
jgi:hypothetical protein